MLSKATKNTVFERANLLCEYCQSPMDFTIKPLFIKTVHSGFFYSENSEREI
jgi:hypothetical protein